MQPAALEAFARAVVDPAAALPDGLRVREGACIAERFAIHRNNVYASLVAALAARFPLCAKFVGTEFFDAMARVYVSRQRPTHEQLLGYGDDFADFLGNFGPVAHLPCLPDLAQLERLWTQSWGAAEATSLQAAELAVFDPRKLLDAHVTVHPAARLLQSAFPVASLWTLQRSEDPDLSSLTWQPEAVLITRPEAQVRLTRLADPAAGFAAALLAGQNIEGAALHALAIQSDFDLGTTLAGLADDGFITELST